MEKQIWGILWFYLEEKEEQEQWESPFIRTDERTARGKPNSKMEKLEKRSDLLELFSSVLAEH